jgi:hypothetical protein
LSWFWKHILKCFITRTPLLQEVIRCLDSHSSDLLSQLQVLSGFSSERETPNLQEDDSAETTPPTYGRTPTISESSRPHPSPSSTPHDATQQTMSSNHEFQVKMNFRIVLAVMNGV